MTTSSVHISQHIRCSAQEAYAFASDPATLSAWAAGLGGPVTRVDGRWRVSTPAGELLVEFAPTNEHGVLDHTVVLPDGTRVHNPMRVLTDGDECEVVFTLRRQPSMTDAEFARDAAAVAQDLATLRRLLESGPPGSCTTAST